MSFLFLFDGRCVPLFDMKRCRLVAGAMGGRAGLAAVLATAQPAKPAVPGENRLPLTDEVNMI